MRGTPGYLVEKRPRCVNTVNIAEGAGRVVQAVTRRCVTRLHTGRRANARHARLLDQEEAAVGEHRQHCRGSGTSRPGYGIDVGRMAMGPHGQAC